MDCLNTQARRPAPTRFMQQENSTALMTSLCGGVHVYGYWLARCVRATYRCALRRMRLLRGGRLSAHR